MDAKGPMGQVASAKGTHRFRLLFATADDSALVDIGQDLAPAFFISIVNTTDRWDTPTGSNGTGGVRNIYFASTPLQTGKTVAFVTLPNISNGVGVFTAMHIFAIAIGGS